MVWPWELQPLPSIIAEPLGYYLLVQSVSSTESFAGLRMELWFELGYTEKFWNILFCMSKDILLVQLPRAWVSSSDVFRHEVSSMNHPRYRGQLEDMDINEKQEELEHIQKETQDAFMWKREESLELRDDVFNIT